MYPESEWLPLSGLQHLAYCERQWALIHVEQFWSENRLTVEGKQLHEQADLPGGKSRRDLRIVRGLPIHSSRLGLSGRADVVEFHRTTGREVPDCDEDRLRPVLVCTPLTEPWQPFPVEYKRGKPKLGNCDRVQLCAQALCLEEMLGVNIPQGALFYGQARRRKEVVLDAALRSETEQLAARMHELFRNGITPRVRYNRKRCDRCSLLDRCLPKITGVSRSVADYLATALSE